MERAHAMYVRFGGAVLAAILPSLLITGVAGAENTGTLKGSVRNANGDALAFVNVTLIDTRKGTTSDAAGEFVITEIPAGDYVVRVSHVAYEIQDRLVQVLPGKVLEVRFELSEAVAVLPPVVIDAHREGPRDAPDTRYGLDKARTDRLPVDDLDDAISTMPGLVMMAGVLHVRGERGGGLKRYIDGVLASDPLTGDYADLAAISVSQTEAIIGGLDAEYGDAQGGVINVVTTEGGDTFEGEVVYMTDDFGAPNRTYDNFDRLSVGFGGPTPVRNLNYYVSAQGTWSDTYLKTSERRERHQVLDFIRVGPRQNNERQLQAKLSWKPGPNYKMTFETLDTRKRWDAYEHTFSRDGFVETRTDTIQDTGEIVTRYGDFSDTREGPNWVRYNAPEHTPNFDEGFRQYKVVANHTLSQSSFYSVKLSRTAFRHLASVSGQQPWEYEGRSPDYWTDRIHYRLHPFFATNGDLPTYTERSTNLWLLRGDWTSQLGEHRLKSGIEVKYNDLRNLNVLHPTISTEDQIGLVRSEYHTLNPEGSWYAQDRWQHEGMVVNAGIRYDMFSVGDQLGASEVENRVREQWSPRLGIAYPVTSRDVLSFHYGRFSQVPNREYIFQNRSSAVPVRGNPNLENQTTVAYQAALQHMFGEVVFGQFTVYFKDIFGWISTEEVQSGDSPQLVTQFVNKDYASSRGFEVSLTKRFNGYFSADLAYTYGVATGLASDPDIQQQVDFLYLPISEQPLDWDQRHTISVSGTVADPLHWSVSVLWNFGTGFPYTPRLRDERESDPAKINTGRLPAVSTLTIQAEKHFTIWGQAVRLFLRGNNILDAKNIQQLSPQNWPPPPGTLPTDYEVFYTETGRAGGAYRGEDLNEDGITDWVALHDPRVFAEGRSVRIGAGLAF